MKKFWMEILCWIRWQAKYVCVFSQVCECVLLQTILMYHFMQKKNKIWRWVFNSVCHSRFIRFPVTFVLLILFVITVQCHYNMVSFLKNIHKRHPRVRARYGVSFVNPTSDWYSALVPVNIYIISYNMGPHYNGTWLYVVLLKTSQQQAVT